MNPKKYIFLLLLVFLNNLFVGQTDSTTYSFFIAGHTYGAPGVNNTGLHPPFKDKFEYIQSRQEIKFGILTGDIVSPNPVAQDWDEVDADIDTLGLPIYFAVGNHDMENRPLFESRYGDTYYSFIYHDDLFIVLDPNIDAWSITGDQLEFLENTVDSNYQQVNNIFVFFHQLLWWSPYNIYSSYKPNSTAGLIWPINFWSYIEPLFHQLPNPVIICAGDIGAGSWSGDFMYDKYDNITFIASGMGEGIGDNFVVINVDSSKSTTYDLICLSDTTLNCFGELTDYQVSPNIQLEPIANMPAVYPNPAYDVLTIEPHTNKKTTIQLFNLQSDIVMKKNINNTRKYSYDVSKLPDGLYFLVITNDDKRFSYKVIVN